LSGERTLSPWRDKLPFATSRQRLRVRLAGVNVQMHATVPGSAVLISATAAANRRCPSKARDGRNTSPNWSSTPRARGCLASWYRLRCSQPPRRWSGEAPRVHRALREPSPWSLRACRPCGTPSLQLSADHILGPRQAPAVHLADNGIAGDSDLAGDLAARKPSMKATNSRSHNSRIC